MTDNRKIIRIFLIIFIVVTICRENDWLSLSYYKSQANSAQSQSFNDFSMGNAESLKDVPLTVQCMGYEYGGKGNVNHSAVRVDVLDISYGALWVPLFKHTRFDVSVPVSIQRNGHNITGTVIINGTLSINGFCSRRDAKHILANLIMQRAYNTIRTYMDNIQ
ncbi:hypothetical protein [Chitinophaga sp.]|uniref:hypothetical protein n=1 Tax=Chitinophaga sp. TaxID=1869181 RepID=UPI0031E2DA9F